MRSECYYFGAILQGLWEISQLGLEPVPLAVKTVESSPLGNQGIPKNVSSDCVSLVSAVYCFLLFSCSVFLSSFYLSQEIRQETH